MRLRRPSACSGPRFWVIRSVGKREASHYFIRGASEGNDEPLQPKPLLYCTMFQVQLSYISSQSINYYLLILQLPGVAQCCNFKDTLHDTLRDRLVRGVNNKGIQRHLLADVYYRRPKKLGYWLQMWQRSPYKCLQVEQGHSVLRMIKKKEHLTGVRKRPNLGGDSPR